jgi:glycosyltransferase involved in cell wall biosynthesis
MKILIAHNRYQQRGGEDFAFDGEVELLRSAGHDVHTLVVSNDDINSSLAKALIMFRTVENPTGVAAMSTAIKRFQPDIIHIHNFFPLLSPAIYKICHAAEIAVVQTLHNFRPICANGLLFRANENCRLCINHSAYWGALHRCYRHSLLGSIATTRMIAVHRRRKTWNTDVDHYIALSEFSRRIFVDAGFPENRITIKSNFINDPGAPRDELREGALYVGRLSEEKGLRVLLDASSRYKIPLRIVGDGPERAALKKVAPPETIFLGALAREAVLREMKRAAVVVVPSLCYENFPLVILEAFACATPVVGSRSGALAEMIEDGVTGLLTPTGDPAALGERVSRLLAEPYLARQLGYEARRVFLRHFTPERNLQILEDIYKRTIHRFSTDYSVSPSFDG